MAKIATVSPAALVTTILAVNAIPGSHEVDSRLLVNGGKGVTRNRRTAPYKDARARLTGREGIISLAVSKEEGAEVERQCPQEPLSPEPTSAAGEPRNLPSHARLLKSG